MLAVAIYRNRQAGEYIAQTGLLEGEDGLRANPALKVEKDTAATYLRFAETLGLTPAARMRLGLMQVTGQSILVAIREEIDRIADAEEDSI
jgi:P27 family predicted phage terminase small subunit